MNRKWNIAGFLFTAALGTIMHFLYDWTGQMRFVGYFSAVNESTFEHLKLLFFPALLFSVVEYFAAGRKNPVFIPARTLGIVSGIFFILVTFYTISGITGMVDMPVVNIAIFVLAAAVVFLVTALVIKNRSRLPMACTVGSVILLVLMVAAFIGWTYTPPSIGLFIDPTAGK